MKSAVETLEPTRVRITVEVPFDELKPSVDHAYKHIGEQITVPGFRKGHVPARIIDQRVGREAVIDHAINEALPSLYDQAIRESDVRPLGQPTVDITQRPGEADAAADADFVFTAELDIRPEITIPDLTTLAVTVDSTDVTDGDVDERLDTLREQFGSLIPVDRPAEHGDFVSVDLTATIDGEEIDTVAGVSYQIGSGNMLDGLDEALLGLSAGETTTFGSSLAGGEHAGEEATISVTAQSIKMRELPEANDDFAQFASEFDTLEELRADLREQVGQAKVSNQAIQARNALLDTLLDTLEFEVPTRVIDAEVARHLESEGKAEDDPHAEEVRPDAERALRQQLILDELASSLAVSVNQDELLRYLVQTASQYGMDPNQFIQMVDQQGQVPAMVAEVARTKASAVALRAVTVNDSNGNVVDLSAFIGTDEADAAASEDEDDDAAPGSDDDSDSANPASINI